MLYHIKKLITSENEENERKIEKQENKSKKEWNSKFFELF